MNCRRCGPTDNVLWFTRKGQERQEARCKPCSYAHTAKWREANPSPTSPAYDLWRDGGAEYWHLRHNAGMTPEEIAGKHGIRWVSFKRTLYRRVGPKESW